MRIKKISNTRPVSASIVNEYNTSTENGYGCDYINKLTNIITAYPSENFTLTTGGSYLTIPLNDSLSVGEALTTNNNSIICGKTGVVKISGKISFNGNPTADLKWLTIFNGNSAVNANPSYNTGIRTTLVAPPLLIEVNNGDALTLQINGTNGDVVRGGQAYTEITVEYVN